MSVREPRPSLEQSVKTFNAVQREIDRLREQDVTYEKIGSLYGVSRGWAWHVHHGIEPKSPEIRVKFGLQPIVTPEMYLNYRVCSVEGCTMPFIPNSPLRTRCFLCSPYKGKT